MRKARAALAIAALVAAALSTTGTAQARGDKWVKVPDAGPYTIRDCGTRVTVTEVVNREYQRVTTDADGTTHIQVRGAYKLRVTTKDGRTALINASGPGFHTLTEAGVYTFDGRGLNIFNLDRMAQEALNLPALSVLSGPITVRVATDGSLTLVRAPAHVRDVCDLLR
jgi:hypothetical protein